MEGQLALTMFIVVCGVLLLGFPVALTLGGPVHRVVVRFRSDLPGSSVFEDIAAIDDIVFTGLVAADAHPTR